MTINFKKLQFNDSESISRGWVYVREPYLHIPLYGDRNTDTEKYKSAAQIRYSEWLREILEEKWKGRSDWPQEAGLRDGKE